MPWATARSQFLTCTLGWASPRSWRVEAVGIDPTTFDLSVKNPAGGEVVIHRQPQEILEEIAALDAESAEVLRKIRGLL